MKLLYEQFDGTYRKESDYLIPNRICSSSEEHMLVFTESDTCNIY